MRFPYIALMLVYASSAFAQQAPLSPETQATIAVLQQQRNTAMDQAAGFQVQAILLKKELDAIKAAQAPDQKMPTAAP